MEEQLLSDRTRTAAPSTSDGAQDEVRASDDVVVAVQNVGKMYRLYDRPQDRLKQQLFGRFGKSYGREFWALREVNFRVPIGSTFGVIGDNGSGKSTLLQMVSGTLRPTWGRVQARGRI